MAVPYDDAKTFLADASDLQREYYRELPLPEQYAWFGKASNRHFSPSKRRLDGNGFNIQVMAGGMHGARWTNDLNADFGTPRAFRGDKYKVTVSETAASNDVRRVNISLQTTWWDIKRRMRENQSAVDYAKELSEQAMKNMAMSMAVHRELDDTGKLADVNGTPKMNDRETYADCSAASTTGGARFQVDGGSLAALPANMHVDRYTGNTLDGSLYITDYNPADTSVGTLGTSSSFPDGSTTINVNDLADNDSLYMSGEKGVAPKLKGYWFKTPSTGESFFGEDRTAAGTRWLNIRRFGPSAATQLDETHLRDLHVKMAYVQEGGLQNAYAVTATPELQQRFFDIVGQDKIIQFPTVEQTGKLIANYGFEGQVWRSPTLGRIVFEPDPLAPPNKIRGLRLGDWEQLNLGEFEWMPGEIGHWRTMPSSTPGNGYTTTFRMDGLMACADICLRPNWQWELANVTS